jgi:hypothetical protein
MRVRTDDPIRTLRKTVAVARLFRPRGFVEDVEASLEQVERWREALNEIDTGYPHNHSGDDSGYPESCPVCRAGDALLEPFGTTDSPDAEVSA